MLESRSGRQLLPEEKVPVDNLLQQLPEEQRDIMGALISEFLQGQMSESHFDTLWTRLASLQKNCGPRNIQDQIWATLFSFDRNPLG